MNRLRCDFCGQFIDPKSNWEWRVGWNLGFLTPPDPLVICEKCKTKKEQK